MRGVKYLHPKAINISHLGIFILLDDNIPEYADKLKRQTIVSIFSSRAVYMQDDESIV